MDDVTQQLVISLEAADPDAAIRKEMIELIRGVVVEEIARYFNRNTGLIATAVVTEANHQIKQTALRAVREHFNNPQMISNF